MVVRWSRIMSDTALPAFIGLRQFTHVLHYLVGVRGSPERDISSLRALGPGGGQISRVVHVSSRAAFGVFCRKV